MNFAQPLSADTLVSAAVRVVLPWSMCPMVPTFTWGLLRSNFSLAMSAILALRVMEPMTRIELVTSSLPRTRSAN